MFLEHDQTHVTSVSYDFSHSQANRRVTVTFLFTIVGVIIEMVIQLFATKLIDLKLKTGILCNNVFPHSS